MATILILEPDEQLAAARSEAIEQAGLRTIVQESSSGVVDLLTVDPPALIILFQRRAESSCISFGSPPASF